MKIENLISLEKWSKLADVVGQVELRAFLGKSLYRLHSGIYLQVSSFRNKEFTQSSDAPFVTGIFFAPDDGAVRRATALAIEEDTGAPLVLQPKLFPGETAFEYGSILEELLRMRPKTLQETASYRIAKDGKFVHRTIETECYTFYFRGAEHNDREPPYTVVQKLQCIDKANG